MYIQVKNKCQYLKGAVTHVAIVKRPIVFAIRPLECVKKGHLRMMKQLSRFYLLPFRNE